VLVDVKNISQREGDGVVELYLDFGNAPVAPTRALRAFTRVHLGGRGYRAQWVLICHHESSATSTKPAIASLQRRLSRESR